MIDLPDRLCAPYVDDDDRVAARLVLHLTVHIEGPTEESLQTLLQIYDRFAPNDRLVKYKIAEIPAWSDWTDPRLTASGRAALESGVVAPALAPVLRRIREGRAFELRIWDGREIEDSTGSWSFSCLRVHDREMGLRPVAVFLLPLDVDPLRLQSLAREIADRVPFRHGTAGLQFTYHPFRKVAAFSWIFAMARRYWCIDIEDLNATLRSRSEGVRSPGWLTLLGRNLPGFDAIQTGLGAPNTPGDVNVIELRHGLVCRLGAQPVAGDANRPNSIAPSWFWFARLLEPAMMADHLDFEGEEFGETGATMDWVRRFVDPEIWR